MTVAICTFSRLCMGTYNQVKCFNSRLLKLLQEIAAEAENKTMIFVETKRKVDEITRALSRYG